MVKIYPYKGEEVPMTLTFGAKMMFEEMHPDVQIVDIDNQKLSVQKDLFWCGYLHGCKSIGKKPVFEQEEIVFILDEYEQKFTEDIKELLGPSKHVPLQKKANTKTKRN